MEAQINQDYIVPAFFENDSGPITGKAASFTVTISNRFTGTVVVTIPGASVSESPAGSGNYTATVDKQYLTARADFKVVFSDATDELYAEFYFRSGIVPSWSRTRRQIRLEVARLLDTWRGAWELEATGGSTTTAILPVLNWGGEDEYAGMWARFSDGANRGLDRRVTDFDAATMTITFSPALPASVVSADRVEVYRTPAFVLDRAIAETFADAAESILFPVEERLLVTDGTTQEFGIPSDLRQVNRLDVYFTQTNQLASLNNRIAWEVLPGRRIRLLAKVAAGLDPFNFGLDYWRAIPAGYTIAIFGMAEAVPPLYDDSWCELPGEYLIATAHFKLARQRQELANQWPYLERVADRARRRQGSNLPANSREVGY